MSNFKHIRLDGIKRPGHEVCPRCHGFGAVALTPESLAVMRLLKKKPLRIADVARKLDINYQAALERLSRMRRRGLLKKAPNKLWSVA